MPVDINRLTDGWLELESDPGLFTLLLEDFGTQGVQVEEIYDVQKSLEGPVYGFIFLFRWIEERRSRRKVVEEDETFCKDEETVNNMFFAQQVVPNSCATHALLSVLLNCSSIQLGEVLTRLKEHTAGMNPENKGWAIGNTPEIACAHNSHAMPQARRRPPDKNVTTVSSARSTGETFHFVSYVPINGRLFELDGLKPYPVDHGLWSEDEEWTDKFKRVITERLGISNGEQAQDIRFNLMAVVPDRRIAITHKLTMLKTNRQIVLEALQQLMKLTNQNSTENYSNKNSASSMNNSNSNADIGKSEKSNEKKEKTEDENSDDVVKMEIDGTNSIPIISKEQCPQSTTEASSSNAKPSTSTSNPEKFVNVCELDYAMPLQIQTSPSPNSTSSTETSSEIGSAFNSPSQRNLSPTAIKDFKKFVVIKMALDDKTENGITHSLSNININGKRIPPENTSVNKKICLSGEVKIPQTPVKTTNGEVLTEEKKTAKIDSELTVKDSELMEPHTFTPKDLLALLKNLENEIGVCEIALKDENDKREKYKVDDCRRTHNYDEFICTFLSMLAQQGKLAELVQQNLQLKKQPTVNVNRVSRTAKRAAASDSSRTTTAPKRRRGRTKGKKRK
ncbi:ubiquitin carboxyl-terminal hydrolase calypso [Trichogramma pretiosum]|uniref:ubiquitin carboxyl-terminal hydrolase calypso n=1 Tax=Trichogramma pretiosum TaxID=7493 RepID=UPI0006C9B6A6|nr:ubiquitin carboxyl-terminal hydrolase calypso [Trichogramma pretiosum]